MAARKAFPQIATRQRAQDARTEFRLGQAACVLRAPFEPCGFRVLSLAFSASGGSHVGRRRRMGDDIGGGGGGAPAGEPRRKKNTPPAPARPCAASRLQPAPQQTRAASRGGGGP